MNETPKGWGEDPRVGNWLFRALIVVCVVLLLLTPLAHHEVHFAWEDWFGFFAAMGFVAYAFIVFAGKAVRKVLMRDEDYYDRDFDTGQDEP